MIHTVLIDAQSEPQKLAKDFRKALMTGGAVLELDPKLEPAQLEILRGRFISQTKHDLAEQVLTLIDGQSTATSQDENGN